jgi:hypothetical protein
MMLRLLYLPDTLYLPRKSYPNSLSRRTMQLDSRLEGGQFNPGGGTPYLPKNLTSLSWGTTQFQADIPTRGSNTYIQYQFSREEQTQLQCPLYHSPVFRSSGKGLNKLVRTKLQELMSLQENINNLLWCHAFWEILSCASWVHVMVLLYWFWYVLYAEHALILWLWCVALFQQQQQQHGWQGWSQLHKGKSDWDGWIYVPTQLFTRILTNSSVSRYTGVFVVHRRSQNLFPLSLCYSDGEGTTNRISRTAGSILTSDIRKSMSWYWK